MRISIALIGMALLSTLAGIDPAVAQQETANTSAEIIAPAEISTEQATQLLFSPTPGVLQITIPDGSGSATMDLTATGVDVATGAFTFEASRANAAVMSQLMTMVNSGNLSGSLSTGLTVSGFINGQGVQIVVLNAVQSADGSGSLKATITFD